MLNLFLAILLGNFDRARLYQMKIKIIDNFEKLLLKTKSLEKSVNTILPDIPAPLFKALLGFNKTQTAKKESPFKRVTLLKK